MNKSLATFRKYLDPDQAKEVAALLNNNGIATTLTDNVASFDITFAGNTLLNEYEIKINPEDFPTAEKILADNAGDILQEYNPEHYLFQFTDDELYEVLTQSDEWSEFDYKLAQKILSERGKNIDPEMLKSFKSERIKTLSKPEPDQKAWIIAGYIFSLLGGFLGVMIGYSIWTSKKTLPNGQIIYSYSEPDRKNGKMIFYLGVFIFSVSLLLRMLM